MVPKIQDMATLSRRSHTASRASIGDAVEEDVVVEGVAAEGKQDLVPPVSVGGGHRVEEDGGRALMFWMPAAWRWS